jgi:hydroxymethylpyrimidine/phosphomethylpyrimidine kinase
LEPAAIKVLTEKLLPLATLVTPNLPEAEILAEQKISSPEDLRSAARTIHARFGCAVLAKGGHLKNAREAVDIFFDGKTKLLLTAPFIKGIRTHGTGCTYSAAICAALALGHDLPQAVQIGKQFVTVAILDSYKIGNHFALGNFPFSRKGAKVQS